MVECLTQVHGDARQVTVAGEALLNAYGTCVGHVAGGTSSHTAGDLLGEAVAPLHEGLRNQDPRPNTIQVAHDGDGTCI